MGPRQGTGGLHPSYTRNEEWLSCRFRYPIMKTLNKCMPVVLAGRTIVRERGDDRDYFVRRWNFPGVQVLDFHQRWVSVVP